MAERKLGNEHFKDARELILSGATKTDLCEYFNVARETIMSFLKRHNLECDPIKYKCPSWAVAAMLNWGYTRKDLAKAFGVSIPTAIKRAKEIEAEIEGFKSYPRMPVVQQPVPPKMVHTPVAKETAASRLATMYEPNIVEVEPVKKLYQITIPQIGAKFAVQAASQEEALSYVKSIIKIEEVAPLRSAPTT